VLIIENVNLAENISAGIKIHLASNINTIYFEYID
jgi:hypothetical protein